MITYRHDGHGSCEFGPEEKLSARARWVIEKDSVVVIDPETGTKFSLFRDEGAIWDLTARGYPFGETLRMLMVIGGYGAGDAELKLRRCLARWVGQGLMARPGSNG